MNDKIFYERVTQKNHEVAVDNLAKSMNVSREGVNTLYGMVLRHINRSARIKYFVSALVTKRVKELIWEAKLPSDIEGRRGRHGDL